MSRLIRSSLLLGVAVISLAACSGGKGPGELGSKDDIVVRNNGLPQAKQAAAAAAAPTTQTGDFSSTVEQAEAIPTPEVGAAEPLPDNSPAMKQAVQAQADASAPLPSTAMDEATNSVVPADTNTKPIDAVAPTTPVTAPAIIPPMPSAAPSATAANAVPATAPTPEGGVYPTTDYAAAPAATEPAASEVPAPPVTATVTTSATPGPSAVPAGVAYTQDPNAPFSPKAVAAAAAASGVAPVATPTAAPTGNPADPATIRAAQTALKAKGAYTGVETGEIDASFLNALILYQGQNNLPQGGLNEATLKNLGVVQ